MDYKKEAKNLLEKLKDAGFGRGKLEETYGYRKDGIDQALVRGTGKKIYMMVKFYYDTVLKNTSINSIISDPRVPYETLSVQANLKLIKEAAGRIEVALGKKDILESGISAADEKVLKKKKDKQGDEHKRNKP